MTKKEVLELKRRFTKNDCTFTQMAGCYVDGNKNIVLQFRETFLNLEDEEFFKYLELAKKVFSGTIDNNLLNLTIPRQEREPGCKQQFFIGLKDSKLKNDELLTRFYEQVIENYDYVGNYLILLFHDAYDVMTRTNDNLKLDESEETYEYLICAICPVSLSKPGLGYLKDENRFGPRIQDWIVEAPESGFVFPAFNDRSTDVDAIEYYTKNPKEPHPEFMENGLGCTSVRTAVQQKETFQTIVQQAFPDAEKGVQVFMKLQENLNDLVEDHAAVDVTGEEPVLVTDDTITELMSEIEVPTEIAAQIKEAYKEEFGDMPAAADHLLDAKALTVHEQQKKELELTEQVQTLKQELAETKEEVQAVMSYTDENDDVPVTKTYDVLLRVKPEKVTQIKSQTIDGQKCLVIPMAENEYANVNGVNTQV